MGSTSFLSEELPTALKAYAHFLFQLYQNL